MYHTYPSCRTTSTKTHRNSTTFVKDQLATQFGFIIENRNDGQMFILKRGDTRIEFDRLDQLQCWLKGYEFNVVQTSEYA